MGRWGWEELGDIEMERQTHQQVKMRQRGIVNIAIPRKTNMAG
jgi:hypothetical protein